MNKVQSNVGSWKLDDCPHQPEREALTCDGCGKTYQKPILAKVSTPGHVQTYGACPHCMTKVYDINALRNEEKRNPKLSPDTKLSRINDQVKCDHFFGFLNKRAKGTPVPEHCLTCDKMVECLYG